MLSPSVYSYSLGSIHTQSQSIHTASVYPHYLIYPQSLGLSTLLNLSTQPRSIHTTSSIHTASVYLHAVPVYPLSLGLFTHSPRLPPPQIYSHTVPDYTHSLGLFTHSPRPFTQPRSIHTRFQSIHTAPAYSHRVPVYPYCLGLSTHSPSLSTQPRSSHAVHPTSSIHTASASV